MKKLIDKNLLEYYYNENNLDKIFSTDIKSHMELFQFNQHEYICCNNSPLKHIYFFVKGKAKVYNTLGNGKSLLVCFYNPFKILGDLELFDEKISPSNVQALEESLCIGIELTFVKENLLNDPIFLKYICSSLSKKLNTLRINSSINLLYQVENRLASYIIATAENINNGDKSMLIFDENLTDISELLGTSYRHLLRTINTFCSNGILSKRDKFYEINNMQVLEQLSSDLYK